MVAPRGEVAVQASAVSSPEHSGVRRLASPGRASSTPEDDGPEYSRAVLGLLPLHHPVRQAAIWLVEWPWFDRSVLVLIVANCILIAINGPGADARWMQQVELAFTIAFTVELVIKVLALGLFSGRSAYLRDRWHWLDVVVVATSWLSTALPSQGGNYAVLRTFRVLRPLRTVTRVPGMRVLVLSMLQSIPQLFDVFAVMVFMFVVFAIIGVQLFKGSLHHRCVDADALAAGGGLAGRELGGAAVDQRICNPEAPDGACPPSQACAFFEQNPNYGWTSFDDTARAMLTIFVAVTLEGWTEVMYTLGKGADYWVSVVYFLSLTTIGGIFVINLFLAVIFESFQSEADLDRRREKARGAAPHAHALAHAHAHAHEGADGGRSEPPAGPYDLRHVVEHPLFERTVTFFIVLNTGVMMLHAHDTPRARALVLEWTNFGFTVAFTFELGLKVIAYGASAFRSRWNVFDAVLVGLAWLEQGLAISQLVSGDVNVTALRAFRLLRLVRLATFFPGLGRVMRMVTLSINQVAYLTLILVLIMFIAALLGQELFRGRFAPSDGMQFNFDSFGWAFLTIFVVLSGENWNEIMYSGAGSLPRAEQWQVVSFMVVVFVIGKFFVLNLFIAVLLSNIDQAKDAKKAEERALKLNALTRFSRLSELRELGALGGSSASGARAHSGAGAALHHASSSRLEGAQQQPPPVWERRGGLRAARAYADVAELIATDGAEEGSARGKRGADDDRGHSYWGAAMPRHDSRGRSSEAGSAETAAAAAAAARPPAAARSAHDSLAATGGGGGGGGMRLAAMFGGPGGRAAGAPSGGAAPPSRLGPSAPRAVCNGAGAGCAARAREHGGARAAAASAAGAGAGGAGAGGAPGAKGGAPGAGSSSAVAGRLGASLGGARAALVGGGARASGGGGAEGAVGGGAAVGAAAEPAAQREGVGSRRQSLRDAVASGSGHRRPSRAHAPPARLPFPSSAPAPSHRQREAARALRGRWASFLHGDDVALGCLAPGHPLRAAARRVVEHRYFESAVLVLILLSSIALAVDTPGAARPAWASLGLALAEWVFTLTFTAEMGLKLAAHGLLRTPGAYLKSGWNVLDAGLVLTSWLSLASELLAGGVLSPRLLGMLRALRLLRALRPLRVLTHNEGLKLVVNSLFRSFPEVANVLLIFALFLVVFGILGVQLFAGRFSACTDRSVRTRARCVGTYTRARDGERAARLWVTPELGHFDNIGRAMMVLFEMSGLEMWPDVMLLGIGANGVDEAPDADVRRAPPSKLAPSVFFMAWILIGGFFIINLFVGVVIDNFNELKDAQDGSGFLTDGQRAWSASLKEVAKLRAVRLSSPPAHPVRALLFDLVTAPEFEVLMMVLTVVNVGFMAADQWPGSASLARTLTIANYSFTALFCAELCLKLGGLGPRGYGRDRWNLFDALLVLMSVVDVALELTSLTTPLFSPMVLRTLRVFRIMRMLRLVRWTKSIRNLLATLYYAIPALINVSSLLLLLFFIYAVLGMNLFHAIAQRPGRFIGPDANFTDFWQSFLLLVRATTGESWNGLMHDCMVREDARGRCSEAEGTCAEHELVAIAYFFSFFLCSSIIGLNLVIAVILEKKTALSNENALSAQELEHFQEVWSDFDRKGTYTMPSIHLAELLWNLDPPLGLGDVERMSRRQMLELIMRLDIPDHNGLLHFHEALLALAMRAHGAELPSALFTTELNRMVEGALKARGVLRLPEARYSTAQVWAAQLIQRRWRQTRIRRVFEHLTEQTRRTSGLLRKLRGQRGAKRGGRAAPPLRLYERVGEDGPHMLEPSEPSRSGGLGAGAGWRFGGAGGAGAGGGAGGADGAPSSTPLTARRGLIAKVRSPIDGTIVGAEWISAEVVSRATRIAEAEAPPRTRRLSLGQERRPSLSLSGGGGPARRGSLAMQRMPTASVLDTALVLNRQQQQQQPGGAPAAPAALSLLIPPAVARARSAHAGCAGRAAGRFSAAGCGRFSAAGCAVADTYPQAVTPAVYLRSDVRLARGVRSLRRAYGFAVVEKLESREQATLDVLGRALGRVRARHDRAVRWTRARLPGARRLSFNRELDRPGGVRGVVSPCTAVARPRGSKNASVIERELDEARRTNGLAPSADTSFSGAGAAAARAACARIWGARGVGGAQPEGEQPPSARDAGAGAAVHPQTAASAGAAARARAPPSGAGRTASTTGEAAPPASAASSWLPAWLTAQPPPRAPDDAEAAAPRAAPSRGGGSGRV